MKVQVTSSYSEEDREKLVGNEVDPFESDVYQLQWRPSDQHVMVTEEGELACHVGLVKHSVEVDGSLIPVAGICGVLTRREYRGRGFAGVAMKRAEELAVETSGASFLMLFCRPSMRGWYELQGWEVITPTVWIEQPQGPVLAPLLVMVKQLKQAQWPSGDVHLRSLPW